MVVAIFKYALGSLTFQIWLAHLKTNKIYKYQSAFPECLNDACVFACSYVPTLPLRPAAQVLSLLVPPLTSQNNHLGLSALKKELENTIRQAAGAFSAFLIATFFYKTENFAEDADRANPIISEDEQMAQLKQKYLL
jgi:hypothetical protein